MLCLTRKRDESVYFDLPIDPQKLAALAGVRIEVKVVAVRGNTARIAFAAPTTVQIIRKELA